MISNIITDILIPSFEFLSQTFSRLDSSLSFSPILLSVIAFAIFGRLIYSPLVGGRNFNEKGNKK